MRAVWRRTLSIAALALVLPAVVGQADAASSAGAAIRLQLRMPVVCKIEGILRPREAPGSLVATYAVDALCNSPRGYQIVALHEAGAGSGWVFRYNGREVMVSRDGRTIIDAAEHPINDSGLFEVMRIDEASAPSGAIHLAIEPK